MSSRGIKGLALCLCVLACGSLLADTLYKYRGENGEWIYSDRPPDKGQEVEIRILSSEEPDPTFDVTHRYVGNTVQLLANNRYYAPIEVGLRIDRIEGLEFPSVDRPASWVVPPKSQVVLLNLTLLEEATAPYLAFHYEYVAGDPSASHDASVSYRVPYSLASEYRVSQAYPDAVTHQSIDSIYAVDISMPIGTDVVAAREGVVFDVAGTHFRGGTDPNQDLSAANVIRILHDDGTYAIYAHLNTNTIRVEPGDRVKRGEYIADSGNTGFSSGPHLHFAVVHNTGMRIDSVPVEFKGPSSAPVIAQTGLVLTAH